MKWLTEELRRALEAMACADAGEYLSRRQKAQVLEPATRPAPPPPRSERRVALATGAGASQRAFEYALQCCRQMRAVLDVLSFDAVEPVLASEQRSTLRVQAVSWRSVPLVGEPLAALRAYLRSNSRVLFLVADEAGFPATGLLLERVRKAAWPSHVPLVVVADGRRVEAHRNRR